MNGSAKWKKEGGDFQYSPPHIFNGNQLYGLDNKPGGLLSKRGFVKGFAPLKYINLYQGACFPDYTVEVLRKVPSLL